jgi:prepilin-type N-terminal cleavage/methylation domain-containing protein
MSRASVIPRATLGYSLVELMVVMGVIGVLAAIGGPPLAGAARGFALNAAATQLQAELHRARRVASLRNAQLGVLFVTLDNRRYRIVMEDSLGLPRSASRPALSDLLADPELADRRLPVRELPDDIRFSPGCGPTETVALRFRGYGGWCSTDGPGCPAVDAGQPLIAADSAGARFCLKHMITGAMLSVSLSRGGAVAIAR